MPTIYPDLIMKNIHIDMADDLIRRHEGLRLFPYRCPAGRLTIGYGRNIEDNGISKAEAEVLLEHDLATVDSELQRHVKCYPCLDDVRKAVVMDMCFNLGWPCFSLFRRFLNALALKDYETAAQEMLDSKWAMQVGNRAQRLAQMMQTGEYPDD